MLLIKTPDSYLNEKDILKDAGKFIARIGKSALIIGGKTALTAVGQDFFESLSTSNIKYEVEKFDGYCSEININKYTSIANETEIDFIVGIGGGRVLDLVKAVGDNTSLSVVTVPTIAATCAAWSALSVIYDESGSVTGWKALKNSPKLVLSDLKVISEAPVRYLKAGIGDTIVKWYEAAPHQVDQNSDISLRIGLQTSKLALEILNRNAVSVSRNLEGKVYDQNLKEVVDSIIILAGLVGSINGGSHRAAIAHAVHNSLTYIPDTHSSLHGEKVIFGLIVQFLLEGKSEEEVIKLIEFLNELNLPVTLEQLGIKSDISNKISKIAKQINLEKEALSKLSFEVNHELIEKALIKANELGSTFLKNAA